MATTITSAITNTPCAAAPTSELLKTRTHYMALDGLRGIAAVAVVVFHFMEFIIPDYANSFIGHAYLAVDFFFCLSGFVVAYAYDSRIKRLGIVEFFKLRLIRLQPMVFIGATIGLLTFVLDPFHNFFMQYGIKDTIAMFLSSAFMIPHPAMPERYNNLFYFNPPTWSLFWEYIANIFYGIILFRVGKRILVPLTVLAACILIYTAHKFGNLSIGWGAENWVGGAARLFFSFLAGILVYRKGWLIQNKLGFLGLGILLTIAFLIPYVDAINWITEPIIVILYFPFLVALGAGVTISRNSKPICKFLGDVSYPLYMIHYPFLWVFLSYLETHHPSMGQLYVQIPVITCLLIGFAYLILKALYEPLRKYMKGRLKKDFKLSQ